MPKTIKYLDDIVALAGSSTKLAAELDIHASTVQAWRRSGVPLKYWDKLNRLYGITPAELYTLTKNCRQAIIAPSRIQ